MRGHLRVPTCIALPSNLSYCTLMHHETMQLVGIGRVLWPLTPTTADNTAVHSMHAAKHRRVLQKQRRLITYRFRTRTSIASSSPAAASLKIVSTLVVLLSPNTTATSAILSCRFRDYVAATTDKPASKLRST